MLQSRIRVMTISDVAKGINLANLALNIKDLTDCNNDGLEDENVEDFVNGFFDTLDSSELNNGSKEAEEAVRNFEIYENREIYK